MKLINIVGARPNFMKIAPIMDQLRGHDNIHSLLLHTGQHYDKKMSQLFFEELNIPKPDIYLQVGSDTHARQVAKIMMKFEEVCNREKPDIIMVVGDVNSTLACSLVASKLGIKVAHLEAGLRSFDRSMPEEINRVLTDCISDLLFTPSKDANQNLVKEGIATEKVHLVGNVMIDTLLKFKPVAEQSDILEKIGIVSQNYVLVTLHRPSNVDTPENLKKILDALDTIQKETTVVFPIHPRTRKQIDQFGLLDRVKQMDNFMMIDPVGYLDFQQLTMNAKLVVTDSGGIQEETTYLQIPCITLRENTERPVTVELGTNEIVGLDMALFLSQANKALNNQWKKGRIPELWDGKTSQRVIETLEKFCI